MAVRKAMFAGSWYPDQAVACEQQIKTFLEEKAIELPVDRTVGAIVPHAGWAFSGGIACRTLALLQKPPHPETIIIFGSHLAPTSAPCIMAEDAINTPFGPLSVDSRLAEALLKKFSFETETAYHFSPDNTIELQLPFIKYFFNDVQIVPVGVPPAPIAEEIGRFVVEAARQLNITINVVGSTDLTHYGPNFGLTPYGLGDKAHRQVRDQEDRRIIDRILGMNPQTIIEEALASHNACCAGAAAAAITAAKSLGSASAHLIEYTTSYEKNPSDSFVGYAGVVL